MHSGCLSMAVSTPVPVANRTLAYRSLESGLRPHDLKIDRPQTVRGPLDDFTVSTLRPERERYCPNYMSLTSEWQTEIISVSHFSKLGDDLLAGFVLFLSLLNACATEHRRTYLHKLQRHRSRPWRSKSQARIMQVHPLEELLLLVSQNYLRIKNSILKSCAVIYL